MLCNVCLTNEVIPRDEDEDPIDFCLACHFSGRRFESFLLSEERGNVLGRLRELRRVTSASVWHVGLGRFQLGVLLDDGMVICPGVGHKEGDEVMVEPAIPPLDMTWGISVALKTSEIVMLQEVFDDDELVEAVSELCDGRRAMPLDVPPPAAEEEELISEELARTWVTGTGQFIGNVHDPEKCEGTGCVIHHPSDHPMREWPTNLIQGGIEMVFHPQHTERICEHQNGHPDPDDVAYWASRGVDIEDCQCECRCCEAV